MRRAMPEEGLKCEAHARRPPQGQLHGVAAVIKQEGITAARMTIVKALTMAVMRRQWWGASSFHSYSPSLRTLLLGRISGRRRGYQQRPLRRWSSHLPRVAALQHCCACALLAADLYQPRATQAALSSPLLPCPRCAVAFPLRALAWGVWTGLCYRHRERSKGGGHLLRHLRHRQPRAESGRSTQRRLAMEEERKRMRSRTCLLPTAGHLTSAKVNRIPTLPQPLWPTDLSFTEYTLAIVSSLNQWLFLTPASLRLLRGGQASRLFTAQPCSSALPRADER